MEREFIRLNIAALAVSGVESSAEAMKLIVDRLGEAGHVVSQGSVEDSVQLVRARLLGHIADPRVDVVIVLAGLRTESAGIALDPLITHGLSGFSDLLRMIAYHEIGSAAMLVDAEAAQCKSTFVFVLPAAVSQVKIALDKLLLPQLDYRTRPRNLVMQMPRVAHVDPGEDAVVAAPITDSNTAPMPWITPRLPGEPSVPAVFPPRPTSQQPAVRKSMSMSVAEAMPSASASMSAVLTKMSAAVSVSQQMPVANPFETREPTDVGHPPAPAPPPLPRGKVSSTISAPLPNKPPAKPTSLATLLPVPVEVPVVAAPPVEPEPERKMSSLADLDDDGDDLDELDEGVAEIVGEPPRRDDLVVAAALPDDLPPPRRAEDSLPPLYDDSPRRIAEPRQPRRRDNKALALLLLGLMLAAATTVLVVVIVQKKDREARAATTDHGDLVATRDPAPPPADPRPPIETQTPPIEAQTPPTGVPPTEPKEIEMPPADPAAPTKEPTTTIAQPKTPKVPKTPRQPQAAVRDPADVLATAPVNKVEDGCDEVSCILDKYKPACCARFKPAEVEPPPEKPASGLPEKLDKLMVQEGLAAVKPAVIACGERIAVRGTVKVQVKVSPSGKILKVGVTATPDPELGTCVAGAVRLAKFPETDEGGSFGYPFLF